MADLLRVHAATLAAVQDRGRVGHGRSGVPPNGAGDQYAMAMANALTGNVPGTPVLENTLLDLAFSVSVETVVAVTGAPATVTVDGEQVPQWTPVRLRADDVLRVKRVRDGLYVYVGLGGVVEVPTLLGSCAPDPLVRFGTGLGAGDELQFRASGRRLRGDAVVPTVPVPEYGDPWQVAVCPGPEADWFDRPLSGEYVVAKESNHVGTRLAGPTPEQLVRRELVSRAVPTGSVEIPTAGELIVLRRGRGVTAGYPVAAVVTNVDQSRIAQARPGHRVRFTERSVAEARAESRSAADAVRTAADRATEYLTTP